MGLSVFLIVVGLGFAAWSYWLSQHPDYAGVSGWYWRRHQHALRRSNRFAAALGAVLGLALLAMGVVGAFAR